MDRRTKRIFTHIFSSLFLDLIAFTLILPLLPKILDYYAINDNSRIYKIFDENVKSVQNLIGVPESHNKVLLAGILGSWFSLLQFASSPFLGALSDKFGRKPILLIAMSGSVISYLIWYFSSNNFGLFALSRTIGGLSKANVGLSLAIVSDISDDGSRGRGMAVVGSSFSLAFIIGPLLGAGLSTMISGAGSQLGDQLIKSPAMIAVIFSAINLLNVLFNIEETNERKTNKNTSISPVKSQTSETEFSSAFHYINPKSLFIFKLVETKTKMDDMVLKRTGMIYFYYLLFYSGLEFTLSFLTHLRFGFTSMDQGKLYLFSGVIMAFIQGGYIRRMKSKKESLMALIGLILIGPSFILMGFSTSVNQIYISLAIYSFSSAVVVPCLTTIISSHSPPDSKGVVMGTFRSIGALSRALGPCLSSFMFWTLGPQLCYLCGAIALLIPLYMMKNLHSTLNGTMTIQPKVLGYSKKLVDSKAC